MDLAATAVLHLTVHQYQTIIDGIFRLNAVLHNTGQLQRLAKLDKFVFNSDLQFFLLLSPGVFSPSDQSFLIFWRYLKSPQIQISPEGGNLNTPFQQFTHKTIFRTRSHSHTQSVKNGHAFLVYPFISILISAVRLYVPYGHLHILTAELNSVHSFKHVRLTRTLTFPKLLRTSLVPYSLYFPGFIWPDSD